jgi:light-regulated signal transduction histidine kinase (bacteriophytochrome)
MERSGADSQPPVTAVLDALATNMGLGLLLLDPAGRPVFSNHIALDLLDCRQPDAVAARWAALQSAMVPKGSALRSVSEAFTADLSVEGKPRSLRGQIRRVGGGAEVLLKDRRTLGPFDIQLLRASRMREWVHQCETVVHEANGALNSIQFALALLAGEWPGQQAGEQVREARGRNHVSVIHDNLDKLKGTLRHLLGADDATPALSAFDLRDVVQEAVSTLRMPSRRHRVDLQSRIATAALPKKGHRARIRQALVNIALSRLDGLAERSHLTLEANASEKGFEIVCRDEGTLTEAARAAIFQVLAAESDVGTAADALRLSRAVVESEAGEFQVENDGAGTTFRFLFSKPAA